MLPLSLKPLSKTKAASLRKLYHKKYREAQRLFLVEGSKQVSAFIEAGAPIQQLIGTQRFFDRLNTLPSLELDCSIATTSTLTYLSGLATNTTVIAVVKLPEAIPITITKGEKGLILADIRDPGNFGTILRTACWYGITKVVCSRTTVDCFHPKAVQASMGALAHVHCYYTDLDIYCRASHATIVGATLTGTNLHILDWPKTGWLMIGNESQGIPASLQTMLSQQVTIPQHGPMESLNAASAAAVLCNAWLQQSK